MRGRRAGRAAAATLLAVVAGPLAACSSGEPRLPVGTPFAAGGVSSDRTGATSSDYEGWLPGGRMRFTLDVGSRTTWRGREVSAPSGTRLVHVAWRPDTSHAGSPPWPGARSGGLPGTRVVLEVGGERFRVSDAVHSYDADGEVVMALPGRETDALPTLVLEAGGRRVVVAPGEKLPAASPFTTTARPRGGVTMDLHTPVEVHRSPFVGGLGWAPPGKAWVVVPEAVIGWDGRGESGAGDGLGSLDPRRLTAAVVAADGTPPARAHGRDVAGTDSATTAARAWLVPARSQARLTLQVRGAGVSQKAGSPERQMGTDVDVVVPPAPGG